MPEMDTNMTPEKRFTRIENFLNTVAEHQALYEERWEKLENVVAQHEDRLAAMAVRQDEDRRDLRNQVQTLVSTTGDLAGVSRHLVTVQGELIESNSLLRQLVLSHSERLEGEGLN